MRRIATVPALALLWCSGEAHYMWSHLLVNGTETPEFLYVRDVAEDPAYLGGPPGTGKVAPQLDISGAGMACGRGASASASATATATVLAGAEVGFRLSRTLCASVCPAVVFHPGPGQAYLARAPRGAAALAGADDADWFRIASAGPRGDGAWELFGQTDYNFTIPATTPPGEYLLRVEQFLPTARYNVTQWYVNCAQVNIVGPGGGAGPQDFARFPGTYELTDPGILITEEMAMYPPDTTGLSKYVAPGPPLWKG
ncbi:lytic polysaccharide monooxygenase [Xylariomycetidae sp. FL0641]|nr:lytic polysaccharide monooxygenase [Xylariomycetidae sp. FL0641]